MSLSLPVSPSGAPIDPLLVDRATGRQLAEGVRVVAGPAADARMRRRFERSSRSDRKHKEIAMSIVADVDPAPLGARRPSGPAARGAAQDRTVVCLTPATALEDPSAVRANGVASARKPRRSHWARARNRDQGART